MSFNDMIVAFQVSLIHFCHEPKKLSEPKEKGSDSFEDVLSESVLFNHSTAEFFPVYMAL